MEYTGLIIVFRKANKLVRYANGQGVRSLCDVGNKFTRISAFEREY